MSTGSTVVLILFLLLFGGLLAYIFVLRKQLQVSIHEAQKLALEAFKSGLDKREKDTREEMEKLSFEEQVDYIRDLLGDYNKR